ncbi:MAG: hydroxyacid dehydrogenase [Candidatus Freyarchaeota archaeon]|nr:hydroxyacid dehydrogenase [Candidatus Jordarchaeia archaeon]
MGKKLLVTGMDFLLDWVKQHIKSAEIVCTSNVSEENLCRMVKDADGILYMQALSYPITRKVIECGKKLKFISSAGVGYERIDVQAATDNGVVVMNMPVGTTVSVAEHTVALILACAKNLVKAHENVVKGGWRLLAMGVELWNKTLGIIGFGRIGREVAKRMKGFEMNILVYDPYVKEDEIRNMGGRKVDLETLLRESDIVSIHSPLTKETEGLIGEEELRLMKPTAILINTARGELVDEDALIKALKERRISYAGLDVFRQEPINKDNPLLALDNVVLTPHMAVQTLDAVIRMMNQNGIQVEKALNGIYENVVNPEVLTKLKK